MAFEIAPEADPIVAAIFNLLSPIVGIEARLRATSAVVGQITVNAVVVASQQTQQGFGALADVITANALTSTQQSQQGFGSLTDVINANAATISDAVRQGFGEFMLQNQAQLDSTLKALRLVRETTSAAIEQSVEETQGILSQLGERLKDNILGIPGAFADIVEDPLGSIQQEVQELDALLGAGFGSLGAVLSLGFPLLADTMANIFNIDPQDFQDGIERVLPSMVEMARVAGNAILEE